jgi:virginiamycin B lyase
MATKAQRENPSAVVSWSAPHPHDAWFLLLILFLGVGTVLILSRVSTLLNQPAIHISSTILHAQEHLYPFAQNTGLMQPAIDSQGNIWVGEMYANQLARLNTHTGKITSWSVPHGSDGIMDVAVDKNDKVWYVEQGANYIGRFDPTTQTFHVYQLGKIHGRALGPQDLQFDANGNLWFTAPSGGSIGVIHPDSGKIQTWVVPSPRQGIPAIPYSLIVTPSGEVWFGYLAGGAIGHFTPSTGQTKLYHLANQNVQIFSMTDDAQGHIWFSEMTPGALGMLNPQTGNITDFPVPAVSGQQAAMYEVAITSNGDVWCVNSGSDTLVRYSPTKNHFTIFKLTQSSGAPYGLVTDAHDRLWVTYSGTAGNAVSEILS